MKLWLDDVRTPPSEYRWVKTVNEAIKLIELSEKNTKELEEKAHNCFLNRDYQGRNKCYAHANKWSIELIDIDHDAGDYASDGGDYIKLLDWLEETGRNYPIRIHSMNPVGVENMRRIIQKNGWKEVR